MFDEQNKYYKRITKNHTSLRVNLLISSINIMSRLYSSPVFGFVDSHIAVYNYLCLQQPLFFLVPYKQPSLIVAEEWHHRVRNRAKELSAERGRVVILRESRLCLDDSKSYNL